MLATNITELPASWSSTPATNGSNGHTNGRNGHANGATDDLPLDFLANKAVRTVFGPIPLRLALDWPVMASYDELAGCAAWMGGRIPSFEEAKSLYAYVERRKKEMLKSKLANKVPAVNG